MNQLLKMERNTKKKGLLRFVVFRDKDGDYCAVCLDLNLIEYGQDIEKLKDSILEAAASYLEAVRKENLSDDLLNNPAPKRFWQKARNQAMFFNQDTRSRSSLLTSIRPSESLTFCSLLKPYLFDFSGSTNGCATQKY